MQNFPNPEMLAALAEMLMQAEQSRGFPQNPASLGRMGPPPQAATAPMPLPGQLPPMGQPVPGGAGEQEWQRLQDRMRTMEPPPGWESHWPKRGQ